MAKIFELLNVTLANILSGPNLMDITDTVEGKHLELLVNSKFNEAEEFKGKKIKVLDSVPENLIYILENDNFIFKDKITLYSLTLSDTESGRKVLYGVTEDSIYRV